MTALFLGVDGGGTKTLARLLSFSSDQGNTGVACVLGTGHAGGSNPYSVGWERALEEVRHAASEACSQETSQPVAAVLAIAGCATEEARQRFQQAVVDLRIADRAEVVDDTTPLLSNVPPGQAAIGLIAGTGSSAVARKPSGETHRFGGWGYLIDDGGSGYTLGRGALQYLINAIDIPAGNSSELDQLRTSVFQVLKIDSYEGIKPAIYQSGDPRGVIASLAPATLRLAEEGNGPCEVIVHYGVCDLFDLIERATQWIGFDHQPIEVVLAGSLLERSPYYRGKLAEQLQAGEARAWNLSPAPDAACGCARIAAGL